jgi:hypothetical protein
VGEPEKGSSNHCDMTFSGSTHHLSNPNNWVISIPNFRERNLFFLENQCYNHLFEMTREIHHIAVLLNQRHGTLTKRH